MDKINAFFKPEIVQAPYNVLDQRIESSGWLEKLKKKGVEVYVRSCFLQGLLLNYSKIKKINKKFNYHKNSLDKWFEWCKKNKITPLRACLSFIKLQKKIDYLIIGFDNFDQLKKIVKNFNMKNQFVPRIFTNNNLNLIDPRKWYNR